MKSAFTQWKHVFKLDPAKPIDDSSLQRIAASGTDALMIGGSDGITLQNTYQLFTRVRRYNLPLILEVSDEDAVVPGFDRFFIPVVLNTNDVQWMIGKHQQVVSKVDFPLPWKQLTAEAYVILNPDCTAAQLTQANTALSIEDVRAYAKLAEHFYRFPIFYIEYSGRFGDMELVQAAKEELGQTQLFYGGGIDSYEKADQAAQAADTIVVGNVIYECLEAALETVAAVKERS